MKQQNATYFAEKSIRNIFTAGKAACYNKNTYRGTQTRRKKAKEELQ